MRKLIFGLIAIVLGACGYPNMDKPEVKEMVDTDGIEVALTLEDEVKDNTVWCGTFQLIWNDLKNDLAKQDIVFNPQLKVVENLNKETFKVEDISEDSYYKKIGTPSLKLKEEIENAIKDKFNETSDILDDFDWDDADSLDYFLYVMLKKEFQFENAFEELPNGKFGSYENIKYFGIKDDETGDLRRQVSVLYYNSKDDFAIQLNTKQGEKVILCKKPEGNTFNEIYSNMRENEKAYTGSPYLKEGETVKVPNLKLKEKKEIEDVENKSFLFSNGRSYKIEKALQTIEFELDRTGGKIKSEAGMMVRLESALIIDELREFNIDDTFAMFLIEERKDVPYFAGKIGDITKFQ